MSNKRRRDRRLARRRPWRSPKPRILCICEGRNTEPQYLRAFADYCRNPRVHLEIEPGPGVPRTLVERAKQMKQYAETEARRQRDENLAFDEVWCVHDVDDHPKIDEARVMARDNGILLAVSNPCFELWLLLHFRDSPGPQHRNDLVRMLRRFCNDYDKNIRFSDFADGYGQAVTRACRIDTMASEEGQPGRNSTTHVWRLTESIRFDHQREDDSDRIAEEPSSR